MEKKELRRNGEVRLRHPYKAVHEPYKAVQVERVTRPKVKQSYLSNFVR